MTDPRPLATAVAWTAATTRSEPSDARSIDGRDTTGARFMSAGFVTSRADERFHLGASLAPSEDRDESQPEHARGQPTVIEGAGRAAASPAATTIGQAHAARARHARRAAGLVLGLAGLRADRAAGRGDAQVALAELRIAA